MTFNNKCKICRSNKGSEMEFVRFYLQYSYNLIIEFYENDIDNLNSYNLSNHYNNHVNREKAKFWSNLRTSNEIYEPSVEEQNVLLVKMKLDSFE